MAILCDRCGIEMEQFSVEHEFPPENAPVSGSQVPVGRFGVSGTKGLSGVKLESASEQRVYYKCPRCQRIAKVDK